MAPVRSARTNRTADGKTVAHEDEEMSRLEQAQEIAQRAAQAEYQREFKRCTEAGIDEDEAKEWASDNASFAYDKAFDEACETGGA